MLLDRENLRNRLLRLSGEQKLHATTKAMDDAGRRVSRYVLLQFAVNAGIRRSDRAGPLAAGRAQPAAVGRDGA